MFRECSKRCFCSLDKKGIALYNEYVLLIVIISPNLEKTICPFKVR